MTTYAVIPAAGQSQRMRQQKLLLPWEGSTIIEATLAAWLTSRVDCIVVVTCAQHKQLIKLLEKWNVELIVANDQPEEMKDSIQLGLDHIKQKKSPKDQDAWMVAPADMPTLEAPAINQLIDHHVNYPDLILQPCYENQPGHPVLIPWRLAQEVKKIPADQGINYLCRVHLVTKILIPDVKKPIDIDTPEQYFLRSTKK